MHADVASNTLNPFLYTDADSRRKLLAVLASASRPEIINLTSGPSGCNPSAPNGENCGPLIDELNGDKYFVYCSGEAGTGASVMARFLSRRLHGTRIVLRPVMSLPGWRELGARGCFQPDNGEPVEWRLLRDVVRERPAGVFTFEYDLAAAGFGALDDLSSTLVSTICAAGSTLSRPLHVFVDALSDAFIGTGHLDRLIAAFDRIPSMRLFVYTLAPFITLPECQFDRITMALAFRCEKDVVMSQFKLSPSCANDVALVPGLAYGQFMSLPRATVNHPNTYYLGDDAELIE